MPIFVYTKFKILLIFLKKYVNISEKERKENMKNKAKTIIAFLIMGLVLFIGIIAVIFGIKEQKEKAKFSKDISWKNEKQSEAVCKSEKIVQKVIRYSPYSRGKTTYSLFIALENGDELEVSLEQFEKAKEGNECRTIF